MKYEIIVRDEATFQTIISGEYKTALEAEAAVRTLTEKAEKIIAIKNS